MQPCKASSGQPPDGRDLMQLNITKQRAKASKEATLPCTQRRAKSICRGPLAGCRVGNDLFGIVHKLV